MGNNHCKPKYNKNDIELLKKKMMELQIENNYLKSLRISKFAPETEEYNNKELDIENLIFEGGGIKGIAYCGALRELQKHNLLKNIKRYAGSSVGAITACLLAIGYTIDELEQILKDTNFEDFKDDKIGIIRDFYSLLNDYGYCPGNYLYDWLGFMIKAKVGKENYTFSDLWNDKNIDLIITGTNLNRMNTYYFSHRTYPEMELRQAIRISASYPFVFVPVEFDGDLFIDGGVIDNYPLHLFDGEYPGDIRAIQGLCKCNHKTLGLKLISNNEAENCSLLKERIEIPDIKSFSYNMINLLCKSVERSDIDDNYWSRTICIQTDDISTTEFDISKEKKQFLVENGKQAVEHFIKKRNET